MASINKSSKPQGNIPERPRGERQEPIRNRNIGDSIFRRISEQERAELSQNNFLYNLSQLIAFMGSNSYSWDRVERAIYQSRREANARRGKYAKWEFYFIICFMILLTLFLFDY